MIRVGLFDHAVRVATVVDSSSQSPAASSGSGGSGGGVVSRNVVNSHDMASKARQLKHSPTTTTTQRPQLRDLLSGPLCAITFPTPTDSTTSGGDTDVEPAVLSRILTHIESTSGRLVLLGGQMSGVAMDVTVLSRISKLPSLDRLRGELIGVLSHAAGGQLVSILGHRARQVASVIEGRRLQLESEMGEGGAQGDGESK